MSESAVLVVDDEAAMRTALEASFRRNGWSVTDGQRRRRSPAEIPPHAVPAGGDRHAHAGWRRSAGDAGRPRNGAGDGGYFSDGVRHGDRRGAGHQGRRLRLSDEAGVL